MRYHSKPRLSSGHGIDVTGRLAQRKHRNLTAGLRGSARFDGRIGNMMSSASRPCHPTYPIIIRDKGVADLQVAVNGAIRIIHTVLHCPHRRRHHIVLYYRNGTKVKRNESGINRGERRESSACGEVNRGGDVLSVPSPLTWHARPAAPDSPVMIVARPLGRARHVYLNVTYSKPVVLIDERKKRCEEWHGFFLLGTYSSGTLPCYSEWHCYMGHRQLVSHSPNANAFGFATT
ncbi:hypothetical protein V8F20_009969 [Naviculisporaceae sp. PSN 640]